MTSEGDVDNREVEINSQLFLEVIFWGGKYNYTPKGLIRELFAIAKALEEGKFLSLPKKREG